MRSRTNIPLYAGLVLSLCGFIFLHYFLGRLDWQGQFGFEKSFPLMATFAGLFFLYLANLTNVRSPQDEKMALWASVLFRLAILFCLPNLSDDFYRFAWDGHVLLDGKGVLSRVPTDHLAFHEMLAASPDSFYQELYPHLNSKEYFTVYPPVLQIVFGLAAAVAGEDLLGMVVVMKLFILLAEIGSLLLLRRLLAAFGKPGKWALVYALNPLVVSETVGNLHFEAFMLFFSLLGLWMLVRATQKWGILSAALPFALAIASKLLPVLFFPYLIRRLGWLRAIALGLLTGGIVVLLFALLMDLGLFPHFMDSIRLYFQAFEFNANIYYLGRWMLGEQGYWVNRILPWITMGLILWMALRERDTSWAAMPLAMLLALSTYQVLQPVIHPWYITPLVGLASLTRYRFPVWWSFLLPLTYLAYFHPGYSVPTWLLWLEYGLLFGYMFFEWQFRGGERTLEDWVRERPALKRWLQKSIPARMAIKLDRIARYLDPQDEVLDLGTGNGGLCLSLRQRGYLVEPVDVQDISFFDSVKPRIYDGKRLPYPDGHFPAAMLITVLHHTPAPEAVLDEALRVCSKRLVVMEDIYKNPIQKYLTFFTDSLVNLEFAGHPHTNKTDREWLALFESRGLKLVAREEFRTLVFFRQVIYVLEKP